jgi:branched-chain amino acid transport system ATP-binding protein
LTQKRLLLSVKDLTVLYENVRAVNNVSFDVPEGEIVSLIGSNGAGKSSILRAISGIVAYSGSVLYDGRELKSFPPHKIVALGIAQVPEGRGIFANLTVTENLKLATWQRRDRSEVAKDYERVYSLFPILKSRAGQMGGTLSGGEQQMLAVARALMTRGRMMLLDEPSMGLSPLLVRDIFRILREINELGNTILLVEQNARMALNAASRGYVLETGSIVYSGNSRELLGNPRIRDAYLG